MAFGRKNKTATANGGTGAAPQDAGATKPKSFRRLRGALTGETRKERKAKRAARNKASGIKDTKPHPEDDEETVYGAQVDDASAGPALLASTPKKDGGEPDLLGSAKKTESLQVILLLMDPVSRRFELLQLEFDSNKAIVKDVLLQIPNSVTEEVLRKQKYSGVCDRAGNELINSMRLSSFCEGAEILVAKPEGMAASECARLSRPILSDRNVIAMLKSTGIDYTPVKAPILKKSSVKSRSAPSTSSSPSSSGDGSKNKLESMGMVVVLLAITLSSVHYFLSAPLKVNQVLSPGVRVNKCGLLSLIPKACDKYSLEMGTDGDLTLYGPNSDVEWTIKGSVCDEKSDDDCRNGAIMQDDGTLVIGGKTVTSVSVTGDAPLSPWPFAEAPTLRVKK